MRIISGLYKGRRLFIPKSKLRPSMDKTREALFNMIDVVGLNVLDLFAGSGSVGLESLSRECNSVVFVEKNRKAITTIKQNLDLINEEGKIFPFDVFSFLKKNKNLKEYDLIFIDPPYNMELGTKTLIFLDTNNILNDNVLVIYEHSIKEYNSITELELKNLSLFKNKRYGKSSISFFHKRIDK